MTHEQIRMRLDDLVDGALGPDELREVEQHLSVCPDCRREREEIQDLVAAARRLPREISPRRDLWLGIEARLPPRDTAGFPLRSPERPRWMRGWWLHAAAAVLLVALSSWGTSRWLRPSAPAVLPSAGGTASPPTAFAAFAPAELEYERAIRDLTATLEMNRGHLKPETVEVIERNLGIVDGAIREARAALEKDPGSRELTQMLDAVYGKKLELLRHAVAL